MGIALAAVLLVAGACTRDDSETTRGDTDAADAADENGGGGGGGAGAATELATTSAGCDSGASLVPGVERVTLQSGGQERWYRRHLPPAYDGAQALPLVIDLHGYSEGAEVHEMNSQMGDFGNEHGFVTLFPQGRGDVPFWDTSADGIDVAFIGDLLDEAEATLCIDPTRVYVTGLSNGAMMTSTVACVYADRIAAAAPVAGVAEVGDCTPDRPVPVVSFHGTADPFLDYQGGFGPATAQLPTPDGSGTLGELDDADNAEDAGAAAAADAPAVPEVMAEWAERNGCDDGAPDEAAQSEHVTILTYPCPEGAEVELYRIDGGGHTWPGSPFLDGVDLVGETTFEISANEIIWDFFQAHPLAPTS